MLLFMLVVGYLFFCKVFSRMALVTSQVYEFTVLFILDLGIVLLGLFCYLFFPSLTGRLCMWLPCFSPSSLNLVKKLGPSLSPLPTFFSSFLVWICRAADIAFLVISFKVTEFRIPYFWKKNDLACVVGIPPFLSRRFVRSNSANCFHSSSWWSRRKRPKRFSGRP